MQHDDVTPFLQNRITPMANPDLCERIIHAAALSVREKSLTPIKNFWDEFCAAFALPAPSFVMAMGIFLGALMGTEMGDGLWILSQDWSSYFDIADGDWL